MRLSPRGGTKPQRLQQVCVIVCDCVCVCVSVNLYVGRTGLQLLSLSKDHAHINPHEKEKAPHTRTHSLSHSHTHTHTNTQTPCFGTCQHLGARGQVQPLCREGDGNEPKPNQMGSIMAMAGGDQSRSSTWKKRTSGMVVMYAWMGKQSRTRTGCSRRSWTIRARFRSARYRIQRWRCLWRP